MSPSPSARFRPGIPTRGPWGVVVRLLGIAGIFLATTLSSQSGLRAQTPPDTTRVTIYGTVVDRWSGRPIPNAVVRFEDTDFRARTDVDGGFRLEDILRGSYFLVVEAPGYRSESGGLRVLRTGSLRIPLEPTGEMQLSSPSAPGPGSRILGQVVEMESRKALEGAEVSLGETGGTRITDARGHFEFESVPAGPQAVSVTTLGRAPLTDTVEVGAGQTLEMEIRLAIQPVDVDPMIITATPRDPYLEDMGFYHRRDQGYSGQFVSRQTIEERDPRTLGDLLAVTPGVRVQYGGAGGFEVRLRRAISFRAGSQGGCIPAVYLDDVPVDAGWIPDIPPGRVEGMEVFTGANAPLRYNDPCGVILIWTRRGERGGGREQRGGG